MKKSGARHWAIFAILGCFLIGNAQAEVQRRSGPAKKKPAAAPKSKAGAQPPKAQPPKKEEPKKEEPKPEPLQPSYLLDEIQLKAHGAVFPWLRGPLSGVVEIVGRLDSDGNFVRLGTGVLISRSGHFIVPYHIVAPCLESRKDKEQFGGSGAAPVDCMKENAGAQFKALYGGDGENSGKDYEFEILSFLKASSSVTGKEKSTIEEYLLKRDFVVARLKLAEGEKTYFYRSVSPARAAAAFEPAKSGDKIAPITLDVLRPPVRAFLPGFGMDTPGYSWAFGYLNLEEKGGRGYVFFNRSGDYTTGFLKTFDMPDAKFGLNVGRHAIGSPMINEKGEWLGILVAASDDKAAVISREAILQTFFVMKPGPKSDLEDKETKDEKGARPVFRFYNSVTRGYLK